MNKFSLLNVVLLLCIGIYIHHADGARKTKEEISQMSCKGAQSYLMKEMMAGLGKCTKKLGFKTQKERKDKMNCVFKCVMIEEGILNPDGTASKEKIEAFLDAQVPEKFLAKISPLIGDCVFSDKISLDPSEEFCKSYEPPIKCLMDKVPTFCDQNPDL